MKDPQSDMREYVWGEKIKGWELLEGSFLVDLFERKFFLLDQNLKNFYLVKLCSISFYFVDQNTTW